VQVRAKYRPRHLVLRDFERVLCKHNPMELHVDSPGKDNEYDQEAISILARFHESALQCCTEDQAALTVATLLVQESFGFWFNQGIADEAKCNDLVKELLHVFFASFPRQAAVKQTLQSEIGSHT
jgi:hypothetical protein